MALNRTNGLEPGLQESHPFRSEPEREIAFGRFLLLPGQRKLLDSGKPLRLGGRAFDLLMALVDRAGEVVSRAELEAEVWRDTIVEETSLRVHVFALRKALGDGVGGQQFIVNVPGRGYSFVAPVLRGPQPHVSPAGPHPMAQPRQLPARLTRMVGRSEASVTLCDLLSQRRMVTIAGSGGMGKTTLAIAVAEQSLPAFADGVCFVDLAPVASPQLVPGAVATALGAPATGQEPTSIVTTYLRGKHMLIVLDNCEHVIETAAAMSEALQRDSLASVLATSREPLGTENEWVYRLSPLEVPGAGQVLTGRDAKTFPSIDLFVDCARKSNGDFDLSDENAPLLGEICRRLDGIPLAIELAAAHVQYLGVTALATRLDDRFNLLTRGRRTSPLRQRTLSAMLDWSYELLSPLEQRVLGRLAVFRAAFTIDSALAVAAGAAEQDGPDLMNAIMGLVAKSLVVADPTGPVVRYRLLETTRAYALRKLEQSGELHALSRRHALHMQLLLNEAEAHWATMSSARWMTHCGQGMDDVRGALDWCFSEEGDLLLGIGLTAESILPMYELGFLPLDEYHQLVFRALASIESVAPAQLVLEMRLNAALCLRNWSSVGSARQSTLVHRTLQLAEADGEARYRVTALYGAWVSALGAGDYLLSREASKRIGRLAESSDDEAAALLSDRTSVLTDHFLGEHASARERADRVLRHTRARMPLGYSSPIPLTVLTQVVLARVSWLVGEFDRALNLADACVADAAQAHPIAHIQALAVAAIPIAFWRGDRENAIALVAKLMEAAQTHASDYWQSFARRFCEALVARGWDPTGGEDAPTIIEKRTIRAANSLEADCITTIVDGWFTPESQARAEAGQAGWCAPEILRNVGEGLRAAGNPSAAEARFKESLALAGMQGALAWQLRSATSLARLWSDEGRAAEALGLLSDLQSKLHQGLGTADMIRASQLLRRLRAR